MLFRSVSQSRYGWAKAYLKKACLLDSPKRATFVITERGKQTLAENLTSIDNKYLRQFPEFLEFQNFSRSDVEFENDIIDVNENENTPEENIEQSFQKIRKSLASALLSKILYLSPAFFEKLVVELLVKMGYGGSITDAGKALGKSGDSYRDWETDRKSTRLNSSHITRSRMPSSA